MRLVHLSDLHLGFRQYQRLTPAGINQREADVARTFQLAIDRIIELQPELVVVAGDVFHNVRPTNPAILHAFNQFARLTKALPQTAVVMIAGDHDTPRATETGCILRLFSQAGLYVVDREPERLAFAEFDLSILAVPHALNRPALTPDAHARHNVLVFHGDVPGVRPEHLKLVDPAAVEVSREELMRAAWSYIALGHYHVYHEVLPNAYYSGSIDYTNVDIWSELRDEQQKHVAGKGIIEHDLDTGEHTFHVLPTSRQIVDTQPINARGLGVGEVNALIRAAVEAIPGGIEDKIVRVLVWDLPRHVARELDHRQFRDYKRQALHFHLDTRRPEVARIQASGGPGRRPSLAEVVREKLQARPLENDIDRGELVDLGLRYLRDAENATVPPAAVLEG